MRTRRCFVGAAILALVVASCGGSDAKKGAPATTTTIRPSCHDGTITGAGSTFAGQLVQRWAKDYAVRCPGATVAYQPIGSQAGVEQLVTGGIDFAASDTALSTDQTAAAVARSGAVLHIPWAGGGTAVVYNGGRAKRLNLSARTLAGIFSGTITRWNAAELRSDNRHAHLPNGPIHVIHLANDSPATAALSGFLQTEASALWPGGDGGQLDASPTGTSALSPAAMVDSVKATRGAIGYVETSASRPKSVRTARIKNRAGRFVLPTPAAMTAAFDAATVPDNLEIVPSAAPPAPMAYPMTFPTFAVVFARTGDHAKVDLLKDFLHYAVDTGQTAAADLSFAPLPNSIRDKDRVAIDGLQPTEASTTTATSPAGGQGSAAPGAGAGTGTDTGSTSGASGGPTSPPTTSGPLRFVVPRGGNGGATDVGVTATALTVGNVSTLTGPSTTAGALAGTQAFFAYQNSLGGVFGRQLKVDAMDDHFDADQNRSAYTGLVGRDFASVGSSSMLDDAGAQVLSAHVELPDVSQALSRSHFALKNNFSAAPFAPGWQLGPLNHFASKYSSALPRMAIIGLEKPSARDATAGLRAAAESVGYHFIYSATISAAESDFSQHVVNMRRVNVGGLMMLADVNSMGRLARAMQQQGVRIPFANWGAAGYDPAFLTTGGATDGGVIAQPAVMYGGEDALPEVQLFLRWLKQVAANQHPNVDAAYGWASARLFVEALGAAGPKATRAGVMAKLKTIDNFDSNGMLAPAGPASKRPPVCFMTMTITAAKFVRTDPAAGFICNEGGYYKLP